MKKKFLLIGLLIVMFTLTGCGSKKLLTTDNFKTISSNNNFKIYDVLEQYSEYDFINEATVAANDDKWQVEFYVLEDSENAKDMFNNNKSIFETYKGKNSLESSTALGNYENYSLTSSGYYMYICRVDNTLVYASVKDSYKDEVKEFIEKLGY